MNNNLELVHKSDSIHVCKESGTEVNYFIFEEAEIHLNKIKPHTVQEWHYHEKIDENLLITKGTLLCRYLDDKDKEQTCYANAGDVVRVHNSIHTFENDTADEVEFVVFRYVPKGIDQKLIIKNDKKIVERSCNV